MGSLNRVTLLGNLGADPKVQQTKNGNKCVTFSLATSEPAYTLQNGTQVPEKTEWHNIVAWGGTAGVVEKCLRKGCQVYVEGKLRTRKYTDSNGVDKYTTEIVTENVVLLKGNTANTGSTAPQNATNVQTTAQPAPVAQKAKTEDDLPF